MESGRQAKGGQRNNWNSGGWGPGAWGNKKWQTNDVPGAGTANDVPRVFVLRGGPSQREDSQGVCLRSKVCVVDEFDIVIDSKAQDLVDDSV